MAIVLSTADYASYQAAGGSSPDWGTSYAVGTADTFVLTNNTPKITGYEVGTDQLGIFADASAISGLETRVNSDGNVVLFGDVSFVASDGSTTAYSINVEIEGVGSVDDLDLVSGVPGGTFTAVSVPPVSQGGYVFDADALADLESSTSSVGDFVGSEATLTSTTGRADYFVLGDSTQNVSGYVTGEDILVFYAESDKVSNLYTAIDPTTGFVRLTATITDGPTTSDTSPSGPRSTYDVDVIIDGITSVADLELRAGVADAGSATPLTLPAADSTAPVLNGDPAGTTVKIDVAENTTAVATVTADEEIVSYTIDTNTNTSADNALFQIDANGNLSFKTAPDFETPASASNSNVYSVEVAATDRGGNITSATYEINVTNDPSDDAPAAVAPTAAPSFSTSGAINAQVIENVEAITTVADALTDSTGVTYALTGGIDEAFFNIDSNTGALTWKDSAGADFEAFGSSTGTNTYYVQVTATNSIGSTNGTYAVTVTDDVSDNNNAPTFASANSFSVTEGATDVGTVVATDADAGDTVSYSLGGADAGLFNLDTSTGALEFKVAPDFEAPGSAANSNAYALEITASDGSDSTTQQLTVNVDNDPADDAGTVNPTTPVANNAPVFTSVASFNVTEGAVAVGTVAATDADTSDTVSYTLGGADAGLFTLDGSSGDLVFDTAPDFEAPGSAAQSNAYSLEVVATDGTDSVTQQLSVVVDNDPADDATPLVTGGGTTGGGTTGGGTTGGGTTGGGTTGGVTPVVSPVVQAPDAADPLTGSADSLGIDIPAVFSNGFDSITGLGENLAVTESVGRLYTAAFGRFPDLSGLQYWVDGVNNNVIDIQNAAQQFINSPEFSTLYGNETSNAEFVDNLYENVLGRAGEADGVSFWNNSLDNGAQRSDVLLGFSESAENVQLFDSLMA